MDIFKIKTPSDGVKIIPFASEFDVTHYGAVGNGVNDDTQAFLDAIADCPAGGTVKIPNPSVKYKITSTLNITKPIRIKGSHSIWESEGGMEKTTMLEFASTVKTGLYITCYGTLIENITVSMLSTSSDTVAAIQYYSPNGGGIRNTVLRNVYTRMAHIYGVGVKGDNVITSLFENVITSQGAYGFYFTTTGTSITFQRCWAKNFVTEGYYIEGYTYLTFINPAADSVNSPNYSYHLKGCSAIGFVTPAAEKAKKTMFLLDGCKGINIDNGFSVYMNGGGTAKGTFAEIVNGSKRISFRSCVDYDTSGTVANVYKDSTSDDPIFEQCDFTRGYSNNGTITQFPTGSYINIGARTI